MDVKEAKVRMIKNNNNNNNKGALPRRSCRFPFRIAVLLVTMMMLGTTTAVEAFAEHNNNNQRQEREEVAAAGLPAYMHRVHCSSHIARYDAGGGGKDIRAKNKKKTCCDRHVDLMPGLTFHWTYNNNAHSKDNIDNDDHFMGALEYHRRSSNELNWLGLGFSLDDNSHDGSMMIGSRALIGTPSDLYSTGTGEVKLYDLNSKADDSSGVVVDPIFGNNNYYYGGYVNTTEVQGQPEEELAGFVTTNMTMHFFLDQLWSVARHPNTSRDHNKVGTTANISTDSSSIVNMIFAIGKYHYDDNGGGTMGFHHHRGGFRLDVTECQSKVPPSPPPPQAYKPISPSVVAEAVKATATSTASTTNTKASSTSGGGDYGKAAFVAHGFFMTLAFAMIIPIALMSAYFRKLIPRSWIYVHVMCNTLAVFFVVVGVACGFGGVAIRLRDEEQQEDSAQRNRPHLSTGHHWVGLILFLAVLYQVFAAFRRPTLTPPRDKKGGGEGEDASTSENSNNDKKMSCCCGKVPLPSTDRERWHFQHRIFGFATVVMALYQMQTGLRLYATEYNNGGNIGVLMFWMWIGTLVVIIAAAKFLEKGQSKQRKAARIKDRNKNLMPQRDDEDDYEASGDGFLGDQPRSWSANGASITAV